MLFVDDSGKPDAAHPSRAVVVGGFAIDSIDVSTLSRRLLGAKAKAFPGRGAPQTWELKAGTLVKPNPWKRAKDRRFVGEVVRIVRDVGGTMFTATIDKTRMHHPMSLAQTMPLQLQCLVEHFEAECRALHVAQRPRSGSDPADSVFGSRSAEAMCKIPCTTRSSRSSGRHLRVRLEPAFGTRAPAG